jgi:2-polyprenyl-3-methyl-5-hydroxy-6-metoxy-1,4-benzoquinol methylase
MSPVTPSAGLIARCPLECNAGFDPSDILLPEGALLRCRGCGQLLSQVSAEHFQRSMAEFDDPRGTAPDAVAVERRGTLARRRLEKIRALLSKPADEIELLDVGCSSGAFVLTARELGYRAQGVEPAPAAAESARAQGAPVFTGTLQDARFPPDRFDAITLFEVIEHVVEPLPLLRECHRILRPEGVLLIGTGNTRSWTVRSMGARWDYFSIARHGGHVSFFSTVSMRILAKRTGFRVVRIDTRNVRFLDRGEATPVSYTIAKIAAEALNIPARIAGKGHDMLAYLRKRAD